LGVRGTDEFPFFVSTLFEIPWMYLKKKKRFEFGARVIPRLLPKKNPGWSTQLSELVCFVVGGATRGFPLH
jgi:hypothetical protein